MGVAGVVAAIAIPNFVAMQYRAKRAEAPSYVDGIKTAELAYDAAFDTFVAVPPMVPDSSPGKAQRGWPSGSAFDTLGWGPGGEVRGSYWVDVQGNNFVVHGIIDVDGDGKPAHYTATKTINAVMVTTNDTY